jgi:NADH dehydrogenase
VLILGGGIGGVYAALELEKMLARHGGLEVTLVTRDRTLGQLAAIGRRTGVANVFGVKFSGFVAWWLWRTVYLSKLPRLEKKVRVALDWTLDLCFAKDFASVGET